MSCPCAKPRSPVIWVIDEYPNGFVPALAALYAAIVGNVYRNCGAAVRSSWNALVVEAELVRLRRANVGEVVDHLRDVLLEVEAVAALARSR